MLGSVNIHLCLHCWHCHSHLYYYLAWCCNAGQSLRWRWSFSNMFI